jgi:hypothetical protein
MDKVSICNVALSHLANSTEIQDLDAEPSKEAQACRRLFDLTRDEVLRDFPWPFATASAALTLFASNPNTEWGYSYRMPAGKLFFRRILSGVRNDSRQSGCRIGFSPTTRASSFTPTCRTRRRVDQAGDEHRALASRLRCRVHATLGGTHRSARRRRRPVQAGRSRASALRTVAQQGARQRRERGAVRRRAGSEFERARDGSGSGFTDCR